MNNSFLINPVNLSLEEEVDDAPLRERETELIRLIEAIRDVNASESWSTLKEEVFDGVLVSLEKEIFSEARKDAPDLLKLSRLSGQLKWAERYSNLDKMESELRTELTNVRLKLHGTTQENPA